MRFEFLSDDINNMLEVKDIAENRLKAWLAKQDSVVSKKQQDEMLLQLFREEWQKKFNKAPSEDLIEEALPSAKDHPLAKDEDDLDFDEMNDVWDEMDELDSCGE